LNERTKGVVLYLTFHKAERKVVGFSDEGKRNEPHCVHRVFSGGEKIQRSWEKGNGGLALKRDGEGE